MLWATRGLSKALRESPSLKLLELLFFRDFSSLEELAEELFVSLSTLKRLIKKTNTYLSHTFAISIVTSPVQVSGDERQIRLFYLKYFSEAYKISEWPFGDILNLKNCERLLSLLIKEVDVKVHFTLFQHLKILSGVNLIRYYKGYSCSYNNKNQSPFFSTYPTFLRNPGSFSLVLPQIWVTSRRVYHS